MGSNVTLQDVAARANVSSATVSRVLNGSSSVHAETSERVLIAVAELGYRPNAAARVLSGGSSDMICLVVPDLTKRSLSRFYYASLIVGVETAANASGLHVLIKNKQETEALSSLIEERRFGGVIMRVGHNRSLEQKYIAMLRRAEIPFVVVGKPLSGMKETSIRIDIVDGSRALAHHMAEQRYTRILYISGPKRNADSNDRVYGFQLGLTEKGYSPDQLVVAEGDYTPQSGYRAAENHLTAGGIDAVCTSTDHTALGVLTYCASHGIAVPDQVAVAGYDDQDYAPYTFPALTTVNQPVVELGKHAVEQLILTMKSPSRRENAITLAPSLVVRDSTTRS